MPETSNLQTASLAACGTFHWCDGGHERGEWTEFDDLEMVRTHRRHLGGTTPENTISVSVREWLRPGGPTFDEPELTIGGALAGTIPQMGSLLTFAMGLLPDLRELAAEVAS